MKQLNHILIYLKKWPLSRDRFPKQFIRFQGREHSLFRETFIRSLLLASLDNIYVVTNKNYKFLVMGAVEELGYNYPEENILVEPEAKNTFESVDIKALQKHRLENVGESVLEIIEVQMGDYLEEDDILRFDDEYGRK